MNRSGFKRAPQRPAKTWGGDAMPGPRSALERVPDGNARASVPVPKIKPKRSESYRRWVASLPCMACGIQGYSQAAHPNQGRGLGQKACDLLVFPLCSVRPGHIGCHQMHDLLLDMTLEDRREAEDRYIAAMRRLAMDARRPEFFI